MLKAKRPLPIVLFVIFVLITSLQFGCQAVTASLAASDTGVAATVKPTGSGTPSPTPAAAGKALSAAGAYSIALDVNPSIELSVENGLVTKVTAYNDDAKQLVLSLDVTGLAPADAVKKLVEAMAKDGYINSAEIKPYLLISVIDSQKPDSELSDSLKSITCDTLDSLNISCNVKVSNIPSDVSAKAEALGISAGRYMIFDYLAKKEGITIEQAIAKYGSLKVADLMRLYDDMDHIFSDGEKDDPETEDAGISLTDEQKATLNAALTVYQSEIKAAEEAYAKSKSEAINSLKAQWAELKAKYKGDRNSTEYKQAKKDLKQSYEKLRAQIHDTFKSAVESAQATFKASVASLGLTDEQLDKLLNYQVNDKAGDDSDRYMNDGAKDDESSGKDEGAKATDQGGNKDDQNADEGDNEGAHATATAHATAGNGDRDDQDVDEDENEGDHATAHATATAGSGDDETVDHHGDGQDEDSESTPHPTETHSGHEGDNTHDASGDSED